MALYVVAGSVRMIGIPCVAWQAIGVALAWCDLVLAVGRTVAVRTGGVALGVVCMGLALAGFMVRSIGMIGCLRMRKRKRLFGWTGVLAILLFLAPRLWDDGTWGFGRVSAAPPPRAGVVGAPLPPAPPSSVVGAPPAPRVVTQRIVSGPGLAASYRNVLGAKMVLVRPGKFLNGGDETPEQVMQGIPGEQALDTFRSEHPRHEVTISRPFYLGACEVTQAEFRAFVNETGFVTDKERGVGVAKNPSGADTANATNTWRAPGHAGMTEKHPVTLVSWNDAKAFCEWLGRKEGKVVRLPTQAEWEYACRAGTNTRYWTGNRVDDLVTAANVPDLSRGASAAYPVDRINRNDGFAGLAPVGSFRPNPFGLYDVHGNVWEWCDDGYWRYDVHAKTDPRGPVSGTYVIRGGCFM